MALQYPTIFLKCLYVQVIILFAVYFFCKHSILSSKNILSILDTFYHIFSCLILLLVGPDTILANRQFINGMATLLIILPLSLPRNIALLDKVWILN